MKRPDIADEEYRELLKLSLRNYEPAAAIHNLAFDRGFTDEIMMSENSNTNLIYEMLCRQEILRCKMREGEK